MCVLPVPGFPIRMTDSRLSMYSQRISSITRSLLIDGWAVKSKRLQGLEIGEPCRKRRR